MDSCQLCCSSTTASFLAAASAEEGVKLLGLRWKGQHKLVWLRKEACNGSIHRARVASEVDSSPWPSPYRWSDVLAMLQMSELRQVPIKTRFGILGYKMPHQPSGYAFHSRLHVAIQTGPHPGNHWIICWWLMLSPQCGPSATNHMNCLLVALKRRHRHCYRTVPNVLCIIETNQILIVIDLVCEVGISHDTPSNVIL